MTGRPIERLLEEALAAVPAERRTHVAERIKAGEDYRLAIRQLQFGASDRVVLGLLKRAVKDLEDLRP